MTQQRFDALRASCEAYSDAVTAGLLPLASAVEFSLHNVDHDTFLKVADHYGAEIFVHDTDANHMWAGLKVSLYADPGTIHAELRLYSGTIKSLAHIYPWADDAFLAQCRTHNSECLSTNAPDHDDDLRATKPSILDDPTRIGAAGSDLPHRGDGVRDVEAAHRPEHSAR